MLFTELLVIGCLLTMLVVEFLTGANTRLKVISGELTKLNLYKQTCIFLWLPTFVLFAHLYFSPVGLSDIGVHFNFNIKTAIAYSVVALVTIYFAFSLNSIVKSSKLAGEVREQMASMSWLMPKDKQQLSWFVFALSVTAGVCEELLFRGFLIHFVTEQANIYLAVIVSSVLFGLCHLYQGWQNVLRTGIVGLVLALFYLLTESLVAAMLLHFLLDAYAGLMFYIAQQKEEAGQQSLKAVKA